MSNLPPLPIWDGVGVFVPPVGSSLSPRGSRAGSVGLSSNNSLSPRSVQAGLPGSPSSLNSRPGSLTGLPVSSNTVSPLGSRAGSLNTSAGLPLSLPSNTVSPRGSLNNSAVLPLPLPSNAVSPRGSRAGSLNNSAVLPLPLPSNAVSPRGLSLSSSPQGSRPGSLNNSTILPPLPSQSPSNLPSLPSLPSVGSRIPSGNGSSAFVSVPLSSTSVSLSPRASPVSLVSQPGVISFKPATIMPVPVSVKVPSPRPVSPRSPVVAVAAVKPVHHVHHHVAPIQPVHHHVAVAQPVHHVHHHVAPIQPVQGLSMTKSPPRTFVPAAVQPSVPMFNPAPTNSLSPFGANSQFLNTGVRPVQTVQPSVPVQPVSPARMQFGTGPLSPFGAGSPFLVNSGARPAMTPVQASVQMPIQVQSFSATPISPLRMAPTNALSPFGAGSQFLNPNYASMQAQAAQKSQQQYRTFVPTKNPGQNILPGLGM